jgi:hypothetical protein
VLTPGPRSPRRRGAGVASEALGLGSAGDLELLLGLPGPRFTGAGVSDGVGIGDG